jgi:hypothetical protein
VLFWVKMGYFEFLIIGVVLNIMPVCFVNIDGFVLSCFLVTCTFRRSVVDSLVVFFICCSVLVCFLHIGVFLWCCFLVLY